MFGSFLVRSLFSSWGSEHTTPKRNYLGVSRELGQLGASFTVHFLESRGVPGPQKYQKYISLLGYY